MWRNADFSSLRYNSLYVRHINKLYITKCLLNGDDETVEIPIVEFALTLKHNTMDIAFVIYILAKVSPIVVRSHIN